MRTPFKNSRTMLATATTCAALIGAGSVAAFTAFDSNPTTVRQVTVGGDAQAVAASTSSIAAIYQSARKAVVEITVTGAGQARSSAAAAPSRRRARASFTTRRAT